MGAKTDEVLQQFQAAEAGGGQMTKQAAEAEANRQIGQMFLQAMYASGFDQNGLKKYAQSNPQGYEQLFNEWLVKAAEEAKEIQAQQALEKQAEAEKMQKVAEDILSGRIMAYAFVDELGNIFHELQKMAEGDGDEGKEDESKSHESKEPAGHEEAEKGKEEAEKKEEGGGGKIPPQFLEQIKGKEEGEKKEGSAAPQIPVQVLASKLAIEKKANAGYPVSPEELEFLSNVKLAEAGYPVKWS